MIRPRILLAIVGAAAIAGLVIQHIRGAALGHRVPGGILIGNAAGYDGMSRVVLLPFYRGVANDVAAVASAGARVLEVGCGPGHLSIDLAHRHGLSVTGLDLDPAMIERARVNAGRNRTGVSPSFWTADVAAMPFLDESFDLVVSTLSMHHWESPSDALTEIHRVLRPGGRALIWDLGQGAHFLHSHVPDPTAHSHDTPLRFVKATPWRWPWRLSLTQRIEFVRD
jgi:ubiquinone/menaquinone biosynthesis C-methylase UbiE